MQGQAARERKWDARPSCQGGEMGCKAKLPGRGNGMQQLAFLAISARYVHCSYHQKKSIAGTRRPSYRGTDHHSKCKNQTGSHGL